MPPVRSLGDVVAADLRGANTILKLKIYKAHIERGPFNILAKEAKVDEPWISNRNLSNR